MNNTIDVTMNIYKGRYKFQAINDFFVVGINDDDLPNSRVSLFFLSKTDLVDFTEKLNSFVKDIDNEK